jgi:hypothetical protein
VTRVLVAYASKNGSTAEIAVAVAKELGRHASASRPGVCGRSNGTVPLCSAAWSTPSAGGGPRGGSCAGTDAGCPRCHGGCSALVLSASPSQTIPGRPRGLSRPRPWRRSNAWVLAGMLCSGAGAAGAPQLHRARDGQEHTAGVRRPSRLGGDLTVGRRNRNPARTRRPSFGRRLTCAGHSPPDSRHPPVRSPNAPARGAPDAGTGWRLPGCAGRYRCPHRPGCPSFVAAV